MLTHAEIWDALDQLAELFATSPSGLARNAGLDPTTFNKSKRLSASGKERWPSTESLAKVLAVVGMRFEDFAALPTRRPQPARKLPVIRLVRSQSAALFDEAGQPVGTGWKQVDVSSAEGRDIFALEISGDAMWPAYREGDRILVSPSAAINTGDRIVAKLASGDIIVRELRSRSAAGIELAALNGNYQSFLLRSGDIDWMARIVWVSQ